MFNQDGTFIAAWPQFGEVNSVFVGKDDTIYAGTGFADPSATKGQASWSATPGTARSGPSSPIRST